MRQLSKKSLSWQIAVPTVQKPRSYDAPLVRLAEAEELVVGGVHLALEPDQAVRADERGRVVVRAAVELAEAVRDDDPALLRLLPGSSRKMRPSCGSANRVTSGLPLFPVTEVSGKTTRSQPASAVSAISRRCVSRLCSTSRWRTSTWVAATVQRSHQSSSDAVGLARDDDDVVALLGGRDRPDDADDPVGLRAGSSPAPGRGARGSGSGRPARRPATRWPRSTSVSKRPDSGASR